MLNDKTREVLRKVFHWSIPVSYEAANQRLFTFLPEQLEELHQIIEAKLEEQLAASQAREKVLWDALEIIERGEKPDGSIYSPGELGMIAMRALAIGIDDVALRERLKAERERCIRECKEIIEAVHALRNA